ncbi:MAG: adenylate/guanylate cyclase domain-containing protein, partial [Gammaproteobacteria bacterium]|nr:adenylate/guanylate cyclase domain-containing protein [Gammaproteobacteria bacterium]
MEKDHPSRKLAVILHADIVDSTALVQRNETVAHECIQATFHSLSKTISAYGGVTQEIRGDALVAEFSRASDAVSAALKFQLDSSEIKLKQRDEIKPKIRMGISLGEVVIADGTVTGAGVVLAQRLEQLAEPGGVVVQGSVSETVPVRMPFVFESLGETLLKGFDNPTRAFSASFNPNENFPIPETEESFPIAEKNHSLFYYKKGLEPYEDFGNKTITLISDLPGGISTYGPGYLASLIGMLSGPKT